VEEWRKQRHRGKRNQREDCRGRGSGREGGDRGKRGEPDEALLVGVVQGHIEAGVRHPQGLCEEGKERVKARDAVAIGRASVLLGQMVDVESNRVEAHSARIRVRVRGRVAYAVTLTASLKPQRVTEGA
jgi:hypothetical protein